MWFGQRRLWSRIFYFAFQKMFLTSPPGFALTSAALTKIKFVIPNITREKEYVWAWTARLWQSPSSTTTVPTVQTQHSLGYMSWPWILDRVVKMQWQRGKKMLLLLLLCQWQETCGGRVKQQSCLCLKPLSIQGRINTICSPYRWWVPPMGREHFRAIGSR